MTSKQLLPLSRSIFLVIAAICILANSAPSQTIMVTTSADVTDIGLSATMDDLPGPDGVVSFREALRVSDNEAGVQTVGFNIPVDDWYLPDIYPGLCLIQGSLNWSAFDTVIIDGTTQTDFTGDTNPDGHEVVLYGLELVVNGDNSLVFGLDSSNITLYVSHNCMVTDNTGDMSIDASTGGDHMIFDNEADTIQLQYSNYNIVVGNTLQRVRVYGGGPLFGLATGNQIGGPNPEDRNYITGWGNYGEHGFPSGTTLDLGGTDQTIIENNYIGVEPDGMDVGSNSSTVGIGIITDNHNVTIRNNLIAVQAVHANGGGNYGAAIYIDGYEGLSNVYMYGNTLGLNVLGQPLLGALHGIWINGNAGEYASDIRIGSSQPGEGNIIAGHASTGILLEGNPGITPVGAIRISGNEIYDNGEFGIDLMPNTWDFGHTPNDQYDADMVGANWLQNFPEVLLASYDGQSLQVAGMLHSEPSQDYSIEFFASPECDPSGYGQAQMFIGSTSSSTDALGNATFDTSFTTAIPDGWVVTSTAIHEPSGATSEFSACVAIESSVLYGDINLDGVVNLLDVSPFINLVSSGQYQAEADINQDGSVDLLDVAGFVELLSGG